MVANKKVRVYENLRQRIIKGALQPGMPIHEEDFAREMSVSKTPVREALRQLESEGFVENVRGRGSAVSPIRPQDIREVREIREILDEMRVPVGSPERAARESRSASPEGSGAIDKARYAAIHKAVTSGYLSNIAVHKDRNMYTAAKSREARAYGQASLFDAGSEAARPRVELERKTEWPAAEKLAFGELADVFSPFRPFTPEERRALMADSLVKGVYDEPVDRESAYEILQERAEEVALPEASPPKSAEEAVRRPGSSRQSPIEAFATSTLRSVGSQLGRSLVRGLLGSLLGGKR